MAITLQLLPEEVLINILKRLPPLVLKEISHVNQLFHYLSKDSTLPQKLFFTTAYVYHPDAFSFDHFVTKISYASDTNSIAISLEKGLASRSCVYANREYYLFDLFTQQMSTLNVSDVWICSDRINMSDKEGLQVCTRAVKTRVMGRDHVTFSDIKGEKKSIVIPDSGDSFRTLNKVVLWNTDKGETLMAASFSHTKIEQNKEISSFELMIFQTDDEENPISLFLGEKPLVFMGEGNEVAICYNYERVDIFNLTSQKTILLKINKMPSIMHSTTFPDDVYLHKNKFIIIQHDGFELKIDIFNTKTGDLIRRIDTGLVVHAPWEQQSIHAISENMLVIGYCGIESSDNPYIKCFDLTNGELIAKFPVGKNILQALAFDYSNPNETYLIMSVQEEKSQRTNSVKDQFILFSSNPIVEGPVDPSLKAILCSKVSPTPEEETFLFNGCCNCIKAFFTAIWDCFCNTLCGVSLK